MLDEFWLPDPLERGSERKPVEINESSRTPRFPLIRLIGRFSQNALANWWSRRTGRADPDGPAIRLRETFEDLGGLWIKVGQLLSLRTDVFSEPVCRELSKLQSRALGFPLSDVQAVLKESYGDDLDDVFEYFSAEPLAAASISQVHMAILREPNVVVAVKVLRPQAEIAFMRDLKQIKTLFKLFDLFESLHYLHLLDAYWELEQMVKEELDFRYEAANTKRMRKQLKAHDVYVPKVFRKVSTKTVLVTEFLDGVLMSDFIRIGQNDPQRAEAWCRANGVNPKKIGKKLFNSTMRQLFEDNLFHADIHPGNIILLRDNRFALIDFGTIGFHEKQFLKTYRTCLSAMADKDFSKAADVMLRMVITPPAFGDLMTLRRDLVRCYREWESRSHLAGTSYYERSLGAAGSDAGKVMTQYKIAFTWTFMRINRTWSTMDASLNYLIPDANYIDMFGDYFQEARRRQLEPRKVVRQVAASLNGLANNLGEYQGVLEQLVRRQQLYSSVVGGTSEKFIRAISTILSFMRLGVTLAFSGSLIIFLLAHHDDFLPFEPGHEIDAVIDHMDLVAYEWWWVVLGGLMLLNIGFRSTIRSLNRRE
jgi:ubiquinone biosynthesis protein